MGAIGSDHTDTLMPYLPPVGWADVATKRDLESFSNGLRAEMAELRGELRAEIGGLRAELHSEVGGLRAELHAEVGGLRSEMGALRADLHRELRLHFYALTTLILTLSGLVATLHLTA